MRRAAGGLRAVPAAVYALAAVLPVVWLGLLALRARPDMYLVPAPLFTAPTLANFGRAWATLDLPRALANSAVIAGGALAINLAAGVPAAYALGRGRVRHADWILLGLLATQMIPGMAALVPLFEITRSAGLIDTRLGVALVLAARTTPLTVWILKGAFAAVPRDLVDAARVDGLGPLGVAWRVMAPLVAPGLIAAGLFAFVMAWIDFMVPLTLLFTPEKMPFTVLLYHLVGDPVAGADHGALFAAAVLGSAPVVLLFLMLQRHFVRGLTAGAVKG